MTTTQSRVAQALLCTATAFFAACTPANPQSKAAQPRPQQAGQPMNSMQTAARLAAMRAAAIIGDQDGVRRNFEAMHGDMMRSMKIPDAARHIDPESARTAARAVPGVRSAVWIDRANLLAMVDGAEYRSQHTIDAICLQLEPLGDTLAVVVNLQNARARTGDELEILSRNCQLQPGDRAFMQARRQIDVVDPAVRARHRMNQDHAVGAPTSQQSGSGDEAALRSIPAM